MEELAIDSDPDSDSGSGDILDHIQRIEAGEDGAERRFMEEFCPVVIIFIRHNERLADHPCPAILAAKALDAFLKDIKKGKIKESRTARCLLNMIMAHAQDQKNIDGAIDLDLKKFIRIMRLKKFIRIMWNNRMERQRVRDWREIIKRLMRKQYTPYILGLIKKRDTYFRSLRIRSDIDLVEESIEDLVKVLEKDIEGAERPRHYGRLLRRIVTFNIIGETRAVSKKELLIRDDATYQAYFQEIPDDSEPLPSMYAKEIEAILPDIFKKLLDPVEQHILNRRFGDGKKLREIVSEMKDYQHSGLVDIKQKIDESFISRKIKSALKKLREGLNGRGFYSYETSNEE